MNNLINESNFDFDEYINSLPLNIENIEIRNQNIENISNLSRFTQLKSLNLSFNKIKKIPYHFLPDSIEILNLYQNDLSRLPYKLPSNLKNLCICHNRHLSRIISLPNKLERMCCYYNKFRHFPPIPNSLKTLYICYNDSIKKLSSLSENLEHFYCYNNSNFISFPELPSKLKTFECQTNNLSEPFELPDSLEVFLCSNNKLSCVTKSFSLPRNLIRFECCNNNISYVPVLSDSLVLFLCDNNKLYYLPDIPGSVKKISCIENPIYEIIHVQDNNININNDHSDELYVHYSRLNIKKINNLRKSYYCGKFKKSFRFILWDKVRRDKIEREFSPDILNDYLSHYHNDDDEALDRFLNNW